jgi:hypothetical protein
VTGVRFKIGMKAQVVDMLLWDEWILKKLKEKKLPGATRLVDKQHRMVCYFFEKLFELVRMLIFHKMLDSKASPATGIGHRIVEYVISFIVTHLTFVFHFCGVHE